MRNCKILSAAMLLAFTVSAVSAAQPNKNKASNDVPSWSADVSFSNLSNSRYDSAFNEAVFTEVVREALARAGIAINGSQRGNIYLDFSASYVYTGGDGEYRFMNMVGSVRNKQGHALCSSSQSAWWGGPSGASHMRKTAESLADTFLKRCV